MKKLHYIIALAAVVAISLPAIAMAADTDKDGINDLYDNCPLVPNGKCGEIESYCDVNQDGIATPEELAAGYQIDWNFNGLGDACEDSDRDAVMDYEDSCVSVYNPLDANGSQDESVCTDTDYDGLMDNADNCVDQYNKDQGDIDRDGSGDSCDNCPATYNPDQVDSDNDGFGDACAETAEDTGTKPTPTVAVVTPQPQPIPSGNIEGCSLAQGNISEPNALFVGLFWLIAAGIIVRSRRA